MPRSNRRTEMDSEISFQTLRLLIGKKLIIYIYVIYFVDFFVFVIKTHTWVTYSTLGGTFGDFPFA